MEKERKLVKRDYFEMLKGLVERANVENAEDLVAFIDHEVELLNKKSNVKTKAQKETEALVEVVYDILVNAGRAVTATQFLALEGVAEAGITSNQKASALLNKLVKAERIVKTVDKKVSYFSAE